MSFKSMEATKCASCWKLNFDAFWILSRSKGGLGWIVYDPSGSPLVGESKPVKNFHSILILEARVILDGLREMKKVLSGGNPPLIVESDSLELAKLLNHVNFNLPEA